MAASKPSFFSEIPSQPGLPLGIVNAQWPMYGLLAQADMLVATDIRINVEQNMILFISKFFQLVQYCFSDQPAHDNHEQAQVTTSLDIHLHWPTAVSRFSPCEFVDGRIVGHLARLVEFELFTGPGAEIDELDVGGH